MSVIGGTEETTTGVLRLRAMERRRLLPYPVVAINDAETKRLFDNRFGTAQSSLDGIIRATNELIAGKTVVIAGYGHCGRGIASRARGLGADVIIAEVNPIRALEAVMDGFRVMELLDAAPVGNIFIAATGSISVIRREHFAHMEDGAILSNAGHFNVEVDLNDLESAAVNRRTLRPNVEQFETADGRRLILLAEGRVVNLGAADGHPASVMDLSFAAHALAVEWLAEQNGVLEIGVHQLPSELDLRVAEMKLASMGRSIDVLTERQRNYLDSYEEGTK
jgi:adenosylhomocysteinase